MGGFTIRLSSTVFKYRYAEFSMYRVSNSVLAPSIKHSAANPISAREHSKEIIMQQRSEKFKGRVFRLKHLIEVCE